MNATTSSVRHLFPQVFANGYVPIPNQDKRCMMEGWPSVRVDARQVGQWSRQRRWPAIGLRMTPPLLVVDIDVLDAGITAAIERLVPECALRRIGQAPKAARFLRYVGEPFYRIATRRWSPDPLAAKPQWSAVEVFGSGGGAKQFGVFGPHKTDKASGAVLSTYVWPNGRSPANTHIDALPELGMEQVLAIVNEAERMFAAANFVVDQFTRGGTHSIEQAYDLTNDMVFHDAAGGEYDLAALEHEARAAKVTGRRFRITGSFTNDPTSAGSERGLVNISHYGRVCIHDTKTATTHHPADVEPARLNDIDFSSFLNAMGD